MSHTQTCPVCGQMDGDLALVAVHICESHNAVSYGWQTRTYDCRWCGKYLVGVERFILTGKTVTEVIYGLFAEHLEHHGGAQAHYLACLLGINP